MKLLEDRVFFFTTFGGEALSLAATKATLSELKRRDVPRYLGRLGSKLKEGYNALAQELAMPYTRVIGYDARTMTVFDATAGNALEIKSYVQQELGKRGILWGGFHNLSAAHTDADVDYLLSAYRQVLGGLKNGLSAGDLRSRVHGELVAPVFRRTSNFNMKPATKA